MSGATIRLTGHQYADHPHDQLATLKLKRQPICGLRTTTTTKYLTTILIILGIIIKNVTAERFIGCLLNKDVCDVDEICYDDFAFGRCMTPSSLEDAENQYKYPEYNMGADSLLEDEMTRLYNMGYVWTDDYTQCILQTALAAIRYELDYDTRLCDTLLPSTSIDNIDNQNDIASQEETRVDVPRQPQEYLIMTDPILMQNNMDEENYSNANDNFQAAASVPVSKKSSGGYIQAPGPLLLDIHTRTAEEPVELDGIQDQPLERTKFQVEYDPEQSGYLLPLSFEPDRDDYIEENNNINDQDQEEAILDNDYPKLPVIVYADSMADDNDGQEEFSLDDNDYINDNNYDATTFNRHERMDVKKPGPFFESSPNNFYLDKLEYTHDQDEDTLEDKEVGQQEYEIPMSAPVPTKDKRVLAPVETIDDVPVQDLEHKKNYVHISLNNKFKRWREGHDFINALAWELGLPEDALTDRTIENQHVQFKVEPNDQSVDAAKVAHVLDEDITIQKRLTEALGVDIARAAASDKGDRESVFPHGRNLNLLILVVVGASATASLLVGGLIFALARRTKTAGKKVSKLQLSDDIEDRGKLQEEYKQLCRDWSKTSQPASLESINTSKSKAVAPTLDKIKQSDSKESNGSNRSSTSSWSDEPANSSMDISTGHMVLAYMEDHLKNKQRLEQEWVGLCGYEAEPNSTTVAFKAENKKKNRYPDKLPYDHNRVILNALVNATNSDYINASTVTDHDPRNPSYIVCQGPLGQTVADFWQMIWEQGCVVIVMLSRLQDNGYQLCTRYWPEEGSEQYHIFEVHLVSEHVWCEDYLVRSVYLKNTRTGETRTVTQFHFRSWPAHGVPSSTKALLEFRRKVNKSYRGRACPIVVHCSDGVGRSGTYVLIDMVLNRLSKGCKEIDIAATLEHIRDQRGGMVQNRQQFEFCLMAVAEEVHAILKALPQ
jgi:receptor-type tyrosine-protein phosphatase N